MISHDIGTASASGTLPTCDSSQQKHGRKRSPSEDTIPNTKATSVCASSPISLNRPQGKPFKTSAAVSGAGEGSKGQPSLKNISILAANILYVVFQHADQWPVEIMKAFAEDSFGSRTWTDDPRCKLFVANLEISLKTKGISDNLELEPRSASVADDVEKYFSSLVASNTKAMNGATASSSQPKTLSSKEKRKQSSIAASSDSASSSSSGEEEVLESETVPSSLPLPNQPLHSASPLKRIFRPSSFSKKSIRPRYHASTFDLVYEAISSAFQDRLDSKSKQNYRLLQILPPFLSVPRVRCLATRHLDRWLQSPALAGLARNIFGCAVQELSSAEPPLADDLELIENILKLNLKPNQVSCLARILDYLLG